MTIRSLLAAALFAFSGMAIAATPVPTGVRVEHAWIRWLPANLPSAGYAVIVNDSDTPLRLTDVRSADYDMVMLHRSLLASSDSRMEMVSSLEIQAHAKVTLAPGGYHLMLSHAKRTLKPGDKVPMTFEFAGGAELQADFSVLPANSTGPTD